MFDWDKLSAGITIEPTLTKYFNKYFYKMKVYAPYAQFASLRNSFTTETEISRRIKNASEVGEDRQRRNWWDGRRSRSALKSDINLLLAIKELVHVENPKVRFDDPHVTFYAETEQELYNFATFRKIISQNLVSISKPMSDKHVEDLNAGRCLVKTDNGFKYKLCFKEGQYDLDQKLQLHNYLISLGNQVKITKGLLGRLQNTHTKYIFSGAIYTNDPDIVLFILLICPRAIKQTKEIMLIGDPI